MWSWRGRVVARRQFGLDLFTVFENDPSYDQMLGVEGGHMIENEAQLAQAREVLLAGETSLAALRARVEPDDAGLFHAMAEPHVEDIVRIRAEIDEYLGMAAVMATRAPLWFVLEGAALRQGDVSSLILSSWLAKLRKSVLAVTEYLQTGHLRGFRQLLQREFQVGERGLGRPRFDADQIEELDVVQLRHSV